MIRLALLALLSTPLLLNAQPTADVPAPDGLRPGGTLTQSEEPPPISPYRDQQRRPTRNYPDQPPTIPHDIRGYQVDQNFNRCLSCHSRSASETSGAPMVSITHFVDREGQALAAVSPRRYFCNQCHVPQHETRPVVENTFMSIDKVLEAAIQRGE